MIAALFVIKNGVYFGVEGVDPWDEARDAKGYAGPHKVIAHPPCKRWGRYWFGSPSSPNRFILGDDGGCFASAIASVRKYGGVLEHPAHSYAWPTFGIAKPPRAGGWVPAGDGIGFTCHVEQGHYGHAARKATWLYAVGCKLPELKWGPSVQRRKVEVQSKRERAATPLPFRNILLEMVEPKDGSYDPKSGS